MKTRILCLGDSLTYGFGVSRQKIWTTLLQAHSGLECINAACNGNTTGGMLACFCHQTQKHRPHAVFLMGGVNDILLAGSDAQARSNMGALVHLCYQQQLLPVVGIMPPPLRSLREEWLQLSTLNIASFQAAVADYAQWLRLFCQNLHVPFVDFEAGLAAQGGQAAAYYCDGLHMNESGHQMMAATFWQQWPPSLQA